MKNERSEKRPSLDTTAQVEENGIASIGSETESEISRRSIVIAYVSLNVARTNGSET